ncbi:hypothetical protein DZD52_11045 [Xanthomonas nasturtii]|uniref:Uncharacterized protein n=1 Tax=Xanthomonas nasturtii TaxID=1843581 RepID=A0A3E1KJR4_9XANT|nr:hypothetical protein DZD52_11045 [Xanthomonas nasturtii]
MSPNRQSRIPNPKSQIPNPKSQIPNPKSQIPNSKFQIPNPQSPLHADSRTTSFTGISTDCTVSPAIKASRRSTRSRAARPRS